MVGEYRELFNNKKESIGKWKCKAEVKMASEDKVMFSSAKVVSSEYGKSVCFFIKVGGEQYIPISNFDELNTGDNVNIDTLLFQIFEKENEKDILRIKVNK